jgi:AcrR family transcriptional regulator
MTDPRENLREKLLEAAAVVYARTGFRGATTRLIAQEAGVNEVTLFRHFGSKEALIEEALRHCDAGHGPAELPDTPVDPERELTHWLGAHFTEFHAQRSLVRRVLGEIDERPEIATVVSERPDHCGEELCAYLTRLRDAELIDAEADVGAATALLMGVMFAEAVTRDILPQLYRASAEDSIARYVKLVLRALGARDGVALSASAHRRRK